MPRKRLSRKELTQKDEITSTLERVTDYAVDHSQAILIALGAAAAIAIAVIGWNYYTSSRDAASQVALSRVIHIYHDTLGYASDDERLRAAAAEAEQVQADYAGQPAAEIARYYLALAHQGLGDLEQGDRELEELIATGSDTVRPLARYALAESYKKRGDLEAAVRIFQELADEGGYAQGAVLVELGELHEALGNPAEARTYYEDLQWKYPNSPFLVDAQKALKRLGPAGEAPAPETEEAPDAEAGEEEAQS